MWNIFSVYIYIEDITSKILSSRHIFNLMLYPPPGIYKLIYQNRGILSLEKFLRNICVKNIFLYQQNFLGPRCYYLKSVWQLSLLDFCSHFYSNLIT